MKKKHASRKRPRPHGKDGEASGAVVDPATPATGGSGMAAAMAQLLGTRLPADKAPVLAKRKTLTMKQREADKVKAAKEKVLVQTKKQKRRRFMKRPDVAHRAALERVLKKVATKGVVSLLNAIKAHQRGQEEVAAVATTKQKKGTAKLQDKFMTMLKKSAGGASASGADSGAGAGGGAKWGVLRDDYLMGAKIKDWNRIEHERNTEGAAGRGYDEVEDAAWNAAGFDALGSDSDEEEEAAGAGGSASDSDAASDA